VSTVVRDKTAPQESASVIAAEPDDTVEVPSRQFIAELRRQIDPTWYIDYYGVLADDKRAPLDVAVGHYLALGAAASFSPSRAFDEVGYRLFNPDVDKEVEAGRVFSGFEHFVNFGKKEGRRPAPVREVSRWRASHPMYSDMARAVRAFFDPKWYVKTYPEVAAMLEQGTIPTPFMHYLTDGITGDYSPNSWFDEAWYLIRYADIGEAKKRGTVPSGFFHYLSSGRAEGRFGKADTLREIEEKYPGLTRPVGVERLHDFEAKIAPINVAVSRQGDLRLNVLLPTLDKNIMFGGYIALLNFLVAMRERGWPIRILILEDARLSIDLSRLQFAKDKRISDLLESAEFVNLTGSSRVLDVTPGDRFLAYSMWMAHHAHRLAEHTGRRFAFFIQEYEPIFHAYDSWRALGASAYLKPHFAIFNSSLLRSFFKTRRYGVYAEAADHGDASSIAFEHTLSVSGTPSLAELDHNGEKRLLFYARPEAHAARNLFEIGIIALRRAIEAGSFGQEWRFDGVGTLGLDTEIDLGSGRAMHVRPKLELGDYCAALRRYDLGLSLMYAPHPSVVPFEMAASGMVVVTNTFDNRDKDTLTAISPNIVPSALSIEDLTAALKIAQRQTGDLAARVAGSNGNWVNDWKNSFSEAFLDSVERELR